MKKAKVMLMAIAIVGVVGGVLAHNARRAQLLYTEPAGGGDCILATTLNLTPTIAGSTETIELGTTFDDSNPCPILTFTKND